jgi:carbon storage regulator
MLVIRRRPGETLVIGCDIEIEILDASASQVKLGIRAPKNVPVLRKEIQLTRDQNLASAREPSSVDIQHLAHSLKNTLPAPIRPV